MKRVIAALSFAALAVPAFATPFEQTELDRALPMIAGSASAGASADRAAGLPFEQNKLDRALPNVPEKARIDVPIRETSDYNFIAPAQ